MSNTLYHPHHFGSASIVILSFVTTLYVIDRVVSTIDLGTYRPGGGDYRSTTQPTITIESCENECKQRLCLPILDTCS